ncbi:MAG TPA: hypothetical protein VE955_00040 [Candidatus Dormibacteraeota bacterium]|nr:hypothetical protein [Candidatus Dormibacteraeota bacterium]
MGVEEEAQPKKTGSRRYLETLLGWPSEETVRGTLYETTLFTSILEYTIVLFFGIWLITEYFYNVYEQQYFGSFDPVFLVIVLMIASGYGFMRLISTMKTQLRPSKKKSRPEDDY